MIITKKQVYTKGKNPKSGLLPLNLFCTFLDFKSFLSPFEVSWSLMLGLEF